MRILRSEKMKPQPTPVGPRDALRFSKKGDEEKQDQISVDLRLHLEIARKIFHADLVRAVLKLERSVKRMIDLLHEHDERSNVVIAQSGARIVPLQLVDQPARIINADVKPIVGAPQKRAGQFAQFARRSSGQDRQLRAALPVDQTILEINPNLRVSAFEKPLDLTKKRLIHRQSDGRRSSSRLSNRSES